MHDVVYRQNIIDHYRNPRNFGVLKKPTHKAGYANVSCGDQVQFQATIVKGKIKDIAFTGTGCALSVAGASLISEYAKGRSLSSLKKFTLKDLEKLLKIPISGAREGCAMLGLSTLQQLSKK
ncbi:MAG: iron-sulfur cluster assembly scaffold protein [Patescibacteria group bacterium]